MSKLLEDLIKREIDRLKHPIMTEPSSVKIKRLEADKKEITNRIKALKENEAKRLKEIEELKDLLDGCNTNAKK